MPNGNEHNLYTQSSFSLKMRTISRIFRITALVTRILRRVIVHLVTPISLAAITDMTARDFVR